MPKLTLSALWLLMTAAIARIASTPISVETLAAAVLGAPVLLGLTKLDRHYRYVCLGLSSLLVLRCFA